MSRTETARLRTSSSFPRCSAGTKWNRLGIIMLMKAMSSIVEFKPARCDENLCSLNFVPPRNTLRPKTKSRLPIMLPASDAFTRSVRPRSTASRAIISSAALPKVAFSSPPTWPPRVFASSSVASPIFAASGIIARMDETKSSVLPAPISSSAMVTGTNISITSIRRMRSMRGKTVKTQRLKEVVKIVPGISRLRVFSMDVDKDALRKQFASEWEKHYKLNVLMHRGFKRQQCHKCRRMFWAKEQRELCGDPSCIGYQFIGSTPVKRKLGYIDTWKVIEKYFTENGHGYVKPYPTVARWRDDLYFTIASINDFQPYVVNGELEPPSNPLIVPQPCIRFSDISNVGVSGRHYTNFVMIGQHAFNTAKTGNFYWKEEALTHDLNYLKALGIPEEEIIFQEDVWAGGGNFGPCIEYFCRGLELGNCVFMQYEVTPQGSKELNTKVIDMGAGLSRLAWITSGEPTSYETVFGPVIEEMKREAGVSIDRDLFVRFAKISGSLNEDEVPDLEKEKERIAQVLGVTKKELFDTLEPLQALYASADHLCTLLFTVTDGMLPSNSGGGYNLRMVLRRVFGFEQRFGYELDYGRIMQGHADFLEYMFPHLQDGVETTLAVIEEERQRYKATKEKATGMVLNIVKRAKAGSAQHSHAPNKEQRSGGGRIGKEELFTLYKSHGIPPEAVAEVAAENDVEVEMPGNFYALVRGAEGETASPDKGPVTKVLFTDIADLPKTEILYYGREESFRAKVLAIVHRKHVVLDRTAFYPEGGGQVSDTGALKDIEVLNVTKQAGIILHEVKDASGFTPGMEVEGVVDMERRKTIAR